jgi:hypothetical protein
LDPEPIDVIDAWGLGFALGNAVKYISRAGRKPGNDALTDLRKAAFYLAREIARLSRAGDALPPPPHGSDHRDCTDCELLRVKVGHVPLAELHRRRLEVT